MYRLYRLAVHHRRYGTEVDQYDVKIMLFDVNLLLFSVKIMFINVKLTLLNTHERRSAANLAVSCL